MVDLPDDCGQPLAGPKLPPDIQARLWMERPAALLDSTKATHGPMFELTLGAVGRVAIIGSAPLIAEAFAVPKEAYRVGPFNQNYTPMIGANGLFVLDGAPHRRLKRMLAPAFRNRALSGCPEIIARETRSVLSRGLQDGSVPLRLAAHEITLRAFLCEAFGSSSALVDPIAELIRARVWTDLRQWKPWARLSRLRPALRQMIDPEIEARRASPGRGDILDQIVNARDDDGGAMTDDAVFDSLMTCFGTAGDGTSIMLSWGLDWLARAPQWQDKIAAEDPGGPRPALEACVTELLRVQPLLPTVSGRVLERAVTIGGYHVEAGVALAPCLWLAHRDPDVWEDPAAFKPERFLDAQSARPAMFPFGGKERACLGQSLGRMTLRTALDAAIRLAHLTPGSEAPPKPTRFATMLAPPQDQRLFVSPREPARD